MPLLDIIENLQLLRTEAIELNTSFHHILCTSLQFAQLGPVYLDSLISGGDARTLVWMSKKKTSKAMIMKPPALT